MVSHHRVEVSEKLPHDGCQGDLCGFALRQEAAIESTEDAFVAGGRYGGHVKHRTHFGATTEDRPFSEELAAISVVRCQPDQGRNLLSVERSELRQRA